jgi:uncharacterized protein YbjT (DUF2867 family)
VRVAVVGATGTAGSCTVNSARARGYEVVQISRRLGIDVRTGAGLAESLRGVEVVIDASDPSAGAAPNALTSAMADATHRLVDAASQAGVEHLVHLSIANIDKPELRSLPYYEGKRAQIQILEQSDLPFTVVRTTQWYEFSAHPSVVFSDGQTVTVQDWLIQPIAVRSVADILADEAHARSIRRTLAGPDVIALPALVSRRLRAEHDHRAVLSAPPAVPAFATGALLAPVEAAVTGPDTDTWLSHHVRKLLNTGEGDSK